MLPMRILFLAAAGAVFLSAPMALAQSTSPLPLSGAGDQAPGGLTAHDVVGKRLVDADGNEMGHIAGVSRDGSSAEVRPAAKGGATSVDMSELSLGTGARTVVMGGEP